VIDHIGLEVSDLQRSARFYDAILHPLGVRRLHEAKGAVAWGVDHPQLWVTQRRRPAPGYGHVAVKARGKAAVDAAHEAGLQSGGTCDGAPGPRARYGPRYYAAYLRDPDGLRVEIVSSGD
jgi:catechol 2,3-dioxygenase-like lactoylglutathione lyase family enzyme